MSEETPRSLEVATEKLPRSTSIFEVILGLTIAVGIFGAIWLVGSTVWMAVAQDSLAVIGQSLQPPIELSRVPSGVVFDSAEVTAQIANPNIVHFLMLFLSTVPMWIVMIFVASQLLKMVRSVRNGDPFTDDNVRRLRRIGWTLVLATPAVMLATVLDNVLLQASAAKSLGDTYALDTGLGYAMAGVAVLVLAHVWAVGVRARKDTEGLV